MREKIKTTFNDKKKKKKLIIIIVAILIGIIATVSIISLFTADPTNLDNNGNTTDPNDPKNSFGNETIGGEFKPDAKLLTADDSSISNGISTASTTPQVVFQDNFESGDFNKWSSHSDTPELSVTDENAYQGNYSAKFNPNYWSIEYLKKNGAIDMESDDELHLYFSTYITEDFEMGDSENEVETTCWCVDYFVAILEFSNGKTLVYLAGGSYDGSVNTRVIDVSGQVTELNAWSGIAIEDIQNDYQVQFGGEMPTSGILKFKCRSRFGEVYLDTVILKKTPEDNNGNYWVYDGTEVECYFIDVDFKVLIAEAINESNLWAEINLWVTIYNETQMVRSKTFIQESLINVTDPNEWMSWTSISFALPEDDLVYGSPLIYKFDICVEAFGQIEDGYTGAGDWVNAKACKSEFDSFEVVWITYDGYVDVIIAVASVGIIGTTGTVFGIKKHKKKDKLCDCDPNDPDCKCDF
jgi:hypothetical protein